jgi:hypothetical protein
MTIKGGYEADTNIGEARGLLGKESRAAYSSALVYAITGDTRYADNAARFLDAWAEASPAFDGMDAGLQLGSYFAGMLFAADLLHSYEGWSIDRRKQFEKWWREKVMPHTEHVSYLGNNWGDAGLLGVMSAAVVFEDRELLTRALNRLQQYFHTSPYGRRPDDAEWKIARDEHGPHLPAESARKDRGIVYHNYALASMVQCFEIARYTGYDFWDRRTQLGVTIPEVIRQVHAWDFLNAEYARDPRPLRGFRSMAADNMYELVLGEDLQPGASALGEIVVPFAKRTPLSDYQGPEVWAGWRASVAGAESLRLGYAVPPGFLPPLANRLATLIVNIKATPQETVSRNGKVALAVLFILPESHPLVSLSGGSVGCTSSGSFGGPSDLANRLLVREKGTGKLFVTQEGFHSIPSEQRDPVASKVFLFPGRKWFLLEPKSLTLAKEPSEAGPQETDAVGMFSSGETSRSENEKPLNLAWVTRWMPVSLKLLKAK